MAIDFPATPTLNQQFTSAGSTWLWDGVAWNIIPQMTPATASDTPPANPAIGQLWWRASNGQMYIWYDDGNTRQWVQTSTAVAPVPGAWELLQHNVGGGAATIPFTNLDLYQSLRLHGFLTATGNTSSMFMRVSANNGVSYDSAASDYAVQIRTIQNGTQTASSSSVATAIQVSASTGIGNRAFLDLDIFDFNKSRVTMTQVYTGGLDGGGVMLATDGYGQRSLNAAHNAFSINISTGSFTAWDLYLEGIRG